MQKAKKYDWKDSNLALFGSDLERNVKKASAETEKAWKGAGQKVIGQGQRQGQKRPEWSWAKGNWAGAGAGAETARKGTGQKLTGQGRGMGQNRKRPGKAPGKRRVTN